MNNTINLQGRKLEAQDIDFIAQLIAANPTWSRRKLSAELAQIWNWRNAKGDLKDMACRTMMLKLHERGHIQLPPRRQTPTNRMKQRQVQIVLHDTTPTDTSLAALRPLKGVVIMPRSEQEELYNCLLATYHYLSYTSSVGENMSVPSKAKAIKLANPAQAKLNQQPVTELHTLGGNE